MGQADKKPSAVVLVVEDEPLIRMDAVDLVSDAGLQAIEARTAEEALERLEKRKDISILFTDIEMPGAMNGVGLAKVVLRKWPHIKVIVTSGKFRANELDPPQRVAFYTKPFNRKKTSETLLRLATAS